MPQSSTIRLPNRFDYAYQREFNAACQSALGVPGLKEVILDFTQVEYLDSSALGMMLMLQKRLAALAISAKVTGAHGATWEILNMANMQNIFTFM